MIIETKYDVDQEVWFCSDGKHHNGIVKNISISVMSWKDDISVHVNYNVANEKGSPFSKYVEEKELFPSKQELLDSL